MAAEERRCHGCAAPLPNTASYCPECGKAQAQKQASEQRRSDNRNGWALLVGVAFFLILLAALGADTSSDEGDSGASSTGEFTQTWPKDYGQTTCAEWQKQMTYDQQRVAAADMLTSAWRADGKKALPSDQLIAKFQGGIAQGCQPAPSLSVAETAAALYVIGRQGELGP